jgi:hypothetical protein
MRWELASPGAIFPQRKTVMYVRLSSLTFLLCQAGKPDVLSFQGNIWPAIGP